MSAATPQAQRRVGGRPLTTAAALIGIVLAIDGSAKRQVLGARVETSRLATFVLSGDALVAMHDLVRPGSGEQSLPRDVLDMLVLVRGRDIQTLSLSPGIARDSLWVQRLTEAAFPRRVVAQADDRLALIGEALPPGCDPVATEHGVVLARCR